MIKSCADTNGTVLVIRRSGIIGVPQMALRNSISEAKYVNGKIISPKFANAFTRSLDQATAFDPGLTVNPTRLKVDLPQGTVTLWFRACSLNDKASVVFEFDKIALQKMGVPEVMDVIGQVFSLNQSYDSNPQGQQSAPPQASQPPQPDPPTEPARIHQGQTVDEVIAALGRPDKRIDLGAKQIFIYKDVKITFRDGKVSDAE